METRGMPGLLVAHTCFSLFSFHAQCHAQLPFSPAEIHLLSFTTSRDVHARGKSIMLTAKIDVKTFGNNNLTYCGVSREVGGVDEWVGRWGTVFLLVAPSTYRERVGGIGGWGEVVLLVAPSPLASHPTLHLSACACGAFPTGVSFTCARVRPCDGPLVTWLLLPPQLSLFPFPPPLHFYSTVSQRKQHRHAPRGGEYRGCGNKISSPEGEKQGK